MTRLYRNEAFSLKFDFMVEVMVRFNTKLFKGLKMKKTLVIFLLLSSTMLMALDALSTLPKNEKELLDKLISKLNMPLDMSSEKKEEFYGKIKIFLKDNWSTHWMANNSVENSKIKDSNTQIVDLMIYNNERVANITFVYFEKEKQLFLSTKEYLEMKSKDALNSYHKLEKNDKFTKGSESDNYAYFNETGYISYTGYHIEEPAGLVVYESSNLMTLD